MLTKAARKLVGEGKLAEAIASACDAIDAIEAKLEGMGEDEADRDGDLEPPPASPRREPTREEPTTDTSDRWYGGN